MNKCILTQVRALERRNGRLHGGAQNVYATHDRLQVFLFVEIFGVEQRMFGHAQRTAGSEECGDVLHLGEGPMSGVHGWDETGLDGIDNSAQDNCR